MPYKNPPTKHVLCLDLDETLIETHRWYRESYKHCYNALLQELGHILPSKEDVSLLVGQIDQSLLSSLKYSPERFPLAWVLFYRSICEERGRDPNLGFIAELRYIASEFQRAPVVLRPDVSEVIQVLKNISDLTPILVTVGDYLLQKKKVWGSYALQSSFREEDGTLIVCEDKLRPLLYFQLNRPEGGKVIMVGDSLRHDIEPAKKVQATAIHICFEKYWKYQDVDVKPDHSIKFLKELPPLVDKILSES